MKPRPEATLPIHFLMDELKDLQDFLSQPGERMKLLEAYDSFIRMSDRGRMCTYSLKCKGLFEMNMLPELKQRIKKLKQVIEMIENNNE